ncbi:MAG: hypothetical protein IT449_01700 [Phycisphaerales bacterium]|nr:hypothetical protein [Phycisphaerales bacterium]
MIVLDECSRRSFEAYAYPLIDDIRRRRAEFFELPGGSLENLFEAVQRL